MRWTFLAPVVSVAALLAAPASASLSDFRLPGSSTQQPDPERQGPVAPDVPESREVRTAPAPTPTRAPVPTPAPSPTAPRIVVPDLGNSPAPASARTPRAANPAPTPVPTTAPATEDALPGDTGATEPLAPTPAPAASIPLPAAPAVASPVPAEEEGGSAMFWMLAVLGTVAALGFAAWAWRRRQPAAVPSRVPDVERPRLAPTDTPTDTTPLQPLQLALEPLRLSLTLMNATLAYRLEVANRGTVPIVGVGIGADMISAHASMTREQQLSGPGPGAATVQRIERLEPGESRIVEGEFRVPFTQIVPIRQGNAAMLLPLARFRLEVEGAAPVVRTFAVGQPGANAALQPFRLDLGPRVYPTLTQRAFA